MRSTRSGAVYRRSAASDSDPTAGSASRDTDPAYTVVVDDAPVLKKSRAAPGDGSGPLQAYPVLGEDRLRSLQVLPNVSLLPYSFGLRSTDPTSHAPDCGRGIPR